MPFILHSRFMERLISEFSFHRYEGKNMICKASRRIKKTFFVDLDLWQRTRSLGYISVVFKWMAYSWLVNTWHVRLTIGEWRQNLGVTPSSPSSMQVFLLLHWSTTRFYQEFFHKKILPKNHVINLLRSRCWRPFWPGKAQGGIRFSSFVSISNFQFLGHDMDVSDYDGRTPLHLAAAEVKYQQSAYY